MRRDNRKKNKSTKSLYIVGLVLIISILTFVATFVIYSKKLNNDMYLYDSEYLAQYTNTDEYIEQNELETKESSSEIGKKVEELEETNNNIKNEDKTEVEENNTKENTKQKTKVKDPSFILPLDGEIIKEYAEDSLVYSETLKEWTTHLGLDIKGERASVVKASADGIIKYIKNDPRYGLTIIIEHANGFQTLYANLLTTEFVSEGEEVKQGQTIATIGDSSVYEIVDESHLHFEILKNGENVNPKEYIK